MKKKNVFEIVWYCVFGAAMVAGLVFLILGLVGQFGGQGVTELRGFSVPGYIVFPCGALLFVIGLLAFAKTNDKAGEVAARRAARLADAKAASSQAAETESK